MSDDEGDLIRWNQQFRKENKVPRVITLVAYIFVSGVLVVVFSVLVLVIHWMWKVFW